MGDRRKSKLWKLLRYGRKRFFASNQSPITLPNSSTDLSKYTSKNTSYNFAQSFFKSEIPKWNKELVNDMLDKPQLCLLNCLCIIEIRKNTSSRDALLLLEKMWKQYPEILKNKLSLRWIVSTMQAIALSSDDAVEQAICYTGITYSALIKMYESERSFMGLNPDTPYLEKEKYSRPKLDERGLGSIGVLSQDIARNLHADLYLLSMSSSFSGIMLQELLERTSTQQTLFSRLDTARINLSPQEINKNRFCFLIDPLEDSLW